MNRITRMLKTIGNTLSFAALCGAFAMSAQAAGTLPDGYTEVQYIQGDGKSRIKTDYTPNPTTDKAEAVVEWPDSTSLVNNQAVWCARTGSNTKTWTLFKIDNCIRLDYNTTTGTKFTTAVSAGTIYTNTVDRNVVTWSGSNDSQTHTADPDFTESGTALQLFASHANTLDAGLGNWGKHRLYSFKVWQSGELIHYFVPCKDANGVATMVDICDNPATLTLAYYNNTGAFTAGPEGHYYDDSYFSFDDKLDIVGSPAEIGTPSPVYGRVLNLTPGQTMSVSCGEAVVTNDWGTYEYTCTGWKLYDENGDEDSSGPATSFTYTHPSPAEYRKLEWQWASRKIAVIPRGFTECKCIVVTNVKQYINTGYTPTYLTDIQAHYEVPDYSAQNVLYWTRGVMQTYYSLGFILTANADTTRKVRAYRMSNGSSDNQLTLPSALTTTDITLSTEWTDSSHNTFTINGQTVDFAAKEVNSLSDLPIYLFRLNDNGNVNVDAREGTKLYSFKILEEGVVQKEFVPCLRESDSVAGLYDIKGDDPATAFYVNQGTGGSFGYEEKDASAVELTVIGLPSQPGTPYPAYGMTNLEAGVAFAAEMPQVAVTNYLTGEERELVGWTLAVTHAAVTETTYSTDLNKQRCAFTPQEGDTVILTWRWSAAQYGTRTLPAEYEATDCLEISLFDYNRYAFVDTGYIPSLDDTVVAAFELANNSSCFLLCSRENTTMPAAKPHMRIHADNGKWSYMCGTGSAKGNLGTVTANSRMSFAISGRGLYKDGEVVDARFGETELEPEWPLIVGASYNAYDSTTKRVYGANNRMHGNIYAVKVWSQDGTPRIDLRPCTRKADGAKGLYDTVRNVFCPLLRDPNIVTSGDPDNLGTPSAGSYGSVWENMRTATSASTYTARYPAGEQTAVGGEATYEAAGWELRTVAADGAETVVSNDVGTVNVCTFPIYYGDTCYLKWIFNVKILKSAGPNMPQRYSEAEWIEFPGDAYILTDYVPHPDRIKMQVGLQLVSSSLQSIFCSRTAVNNGCYTTILYPPEGQSATGLLFRVSNKSTDFWSNPPLNERLTLCCETNTVWVKGRTDVSTVEGYTAITEAGGPLVLGATYTSAIEGVPSGFSNYSTMRFFGAKVWESGVIVHDYLPCFDRLTGASGVYDTVEGKFIANSAGSHFDSAAKQFPGFRVILR